MQTSNVSTSTLLPIAEILVNGKKRKLYSQHKNKIYLDDGDEFQIKLKNPYFTRIGVAFKYNGSYDSQGLLILNGNEECIIERFLETKKKLTFKTYEVSGNAEAVKKAIKKNGSVEIEFWSEKIQFSNPIIINNPPYYIPYPVTPCPSPYPTYPPYFPTWICDTNSNTNIYNSNNLADGIIGSDGLGGEIGGTTTTGEFFFNADPQIQSRGLTNCKNSKIEQTFNKTNQIKTETGKIEAGQKSSQEFTSVEFVRNELIYTVRYKLLPYSIKEQYDQSTVVETPKSTNYSTSYVNDVRIYCKTPGCGRRQKSRNDFFCSGCGRKFGQ